MSKLTLLIDTSWDVKAIKSSNGYVGPTPLVKYPN